MPGKWKLGFWGGLLILGLAGGCAWLSEEAPSEVESTPDITLTQLEEKIRNARDPDGTFRNARSFVQKQMVTLRRFLDDRKYLIEVKLQLPDKLRLTTLLDNQPTSSLILNGNAGWAVDYQKREVRPIVGQDLEEVKIFYQLSNPVGSYRDTFAQIKLTLCRIGDQEYYKLRCLSRIPGQEPIDIYIGKNNFLLKRMTTKYRGPDGRLDRYDAQVVRYALFDGNVLIPEETRIFQNGVERDSTVFYNKLNVPIDEEEFLPPVF